MKNTEHSMKLKTIAITAGKAGPGKFFGGTVSDSGDVNGDGIQDLIISGGPYVVYGSKNGFTNTTL